MVAVGTTFAGSPTVFGTTDGTGTAARFGLPRQVDYDPVKGLILVADGTERVRGLHPTTAVVTTLTAAVFPDLNDARKDPNDDPVQGNVVVMYQGGNFKNIDIHSTEGLGGFSLQQISDPDDEISLYNADHIQSGDPGAGTYTLYRRDAPSSSQLVYVEWEPAQSGAQRVVDAITNSTPWGLTLDVPNLAAWFALQVDATEGSQLRRKPMNTLLGGSSVILSTSAPVTFQSPHVEGDDLYVWQYNHDDNTALLYRYPISGSSLGSGVAVAIEPNAFGDMSKVAIVGDYAYWTRGVHDVRRAQLTAGAVHWRLDRVHWA